MQTPDPKLFRDMQEHPEKYSSEELEAMMDELDREPDVEAAWTKLNQRHSSRHSSLFTFHSSLSKVAASFIGVILLSGIALAAYHFVQKGEHSPNPSRDGGEKAGALITNRNDSLPSQGDVEEAPVIFDNVPLDTMLTDMAGYYRISLEFEREESRQLRLHFVWKRSESLDRVVERLNNFEAVNIIREPEKLIVR